MYPSIPVIFERRKRHEFHLNMLQQVSTDSLYIMAYKRPYKDGQYHLLQPPMPAVFWQRGRFWTWIRPFQRFKGQQKQPPYFLQTWKEKKKNTTKCWLCVHIYIYIHHIQIYFGRFLSPKHQGSCQFSRVCLGGNSNLSERCQLNEGIFSKYEFSTRKYAKAPARASKSFVFRFFQIMQAKFTQNRSSLPSLKLSILF